MGLFDDLVSHENFGKMFLGSTRFREIFQEQMERSGSGLWDDFAKQKLRIDVDPDTNQVVFTSKELQHTYKRRAGEGFQDFFNRVITGRDPRAREDIWNPSAGFGIDEVRTSEVISGRQMGSYTRRTLGDAAERHNVTFRYRTFSNQPGVLEKIYDSLEAGETVERTLGVVTADTDKHTV